jgi:hypothetical protein
MVTVNLQRDFELKAIFDQPASTPILQFDAAARLVLLYEVGRS